MFRSSILTVLSLCLIIACSKKEDAAPTDVPEGFEGVSYTYLSGRTFADKKVYYEIGQNGRAVVEGDIIVAKNETEAQKRREAVEAERANRANGGRGAVSIVFSDSLWPNGVIPYVLASGGEFSDPSILPFYDESLIKDDVKTNLTDYLADNTALTLVPYDPNVHEEFLLIYSLQSSSCQGAANVGRLPGQITELFVTTGCGDGFFSREVQMGLLIHELGHSAGLFHEQSREDRDDFVTVNLENVIPGREFNFRQHIYDGEDIGPYDCGAIMHYGRFTFSKNGLPTVEGKTSDCDDLLGQADVFSDGELHALETLYGLKVEVQVALSEDSARFIWETATAGTSVVQLGTDPNNLNLIFSVSGDVTDHQVDATGLTPQTRYWYKVKSLFPDESVAESAIRSFYTDATPPVISNLAVAEATHNSITLSWNTDEPAVARLVLIDESNGGFLAVEFDDDVLSTSHSLTIFDLAPSTQYTFRAFAFDEMLNGSSEDLTASTSEEPIVISNINANVNGTSVTITWNTNLDTFGDVAYQLSGGSDVEFAVDQSFGTSHSVTINDLEANSTYLFDVAAYFDQEFTGLVISDASSFTTGSNVDSVSIVDYDITSTLNLRVFATSSAGGAANLTLTLKNPFNHQPLASTAMTYDGSRHFADISIISVVILAIGAELEVTSDQGGSDTFSIWDW